MAIDINLALPKVPQVGLEKKFNVPINSKPTQIALSDKITPVILLSIEVHFFFLVLEI